MLRTRRRNQSPNGEDRFNLHIWTWICGSTTDESVLYCISRLKGGAFTILDWRDGRRTLLDWRGRGQTFFDLREGGDKHFWTEGVSYKYFFTEGRDFLELTEWGTFQTSKNYKRWNGSKCLFVCLSVSLWNLRLRCLRI